MKVIKTVKDIREEIKQLKIKGKSVGFVPTMGFLHDGHISLVKESVANNDVTVVSIFVNPTQFGPNEDLESYPRDLERDTKLVTDAGADIVFFPEPSEIYPDGYCTTVSVDGLTKVLCGLSRPTHFDGVTTVVSKLFNIVTPDRAYFGSKDYQQLQVIKRMVTDLNICVEVVGMPIIREADGLAMSSRNIYLKDDERESALSLSKSFNVVTELVEQGERDAKVVRQKIVDFIDSHTHANVDYVEVVHAADLYSLDKITEEFVVALAVKVGGARLIDNKLFEI